MSIYDDVKARIDIVDFINGYVPLKREGSLYVACCPFHNEKTPSFKVNPEQNRWQCFGSCGEGGDVFDFFMKHQSIDLKEALKTLAPIAGVEIPTYTPKEDHSRFYEANVEASLWFHENLRQKPGTPGRQAFDYLRGRGIEIETIKEWRLGYAPMQWTALRDYLVDKGFTEDELYKAGLLSKTEKGNLIDFWRGRVMIPICDTQGRIIGFGGRAQEAEGGKYINSPTTEIFDKGQSIFGWYKGRKAAKEAKVAVIVEGYMDVIYAHQAGFANVVAPMGTAVAPSQIKILSKSAERIVFAFDGDDSGGNAAERTIKKMAAILRQSSRNLVDIRVLELSGGQDPDEMIKASPEGWKAAVESAIPADDYIINRATKIVPESSIEREKLAISLAPVLHAIERDIQRDFALQKLAAKLGIKETAILKLIAPSKPEATPQENVNQQQRQSNAQERLLCLLFQAESNMAYLTRQLNKRKLEPICDGDFTQPYRTIFKTWQDALDQVDEDPYDYMGSHLDPVLREEYLALLAAPALPNFGFRLNTEDKVETVEMRSMLYLIFQIRRTSLEQTNQSLGMSEAYAANLNKINTLIRYSKQL